MIRFVLTTDEHVEELLLYLHPDMKKEASAITPIAFDKTIRQTVKEADEAWTILSDECVVGIFGIRRYSLLSDKGAPWLLTTTRIKEHVKTLLPLTKIALSYWLNRYTVLENYVPESYKASLRWLKWAGFTIHPAIPIGVSGQLIHRIEMRQ